MATPLAADQFRGGNKSLTGNPLFSAAPNNVVSVGGDAPVEPPVDPDEPCPKPEPGSKLLTADEVLTIKESLVTIARIIE